MLPNEREARIRAGLPVPFAPTSEVEQWMAKDYPDSWLSEAGFKPGVMHRRAGKVEGEGAQHMVQKNSMVGLNRQSGFNRGSTNSGAESVANNPGGTNANVRIYDITPVPPGEYFMRPLSMAFDRISMESALFTTDMGYPFFAEYRNDVVLAAAAGGPGTGGSFQVPGDLSQYMNHNNPVEKVVVINDSSSDVAIGVDSRPLGTAGTFGVGDGAFVVKAGEANTYPVRAYNYVYAINISESSTVLAGQCRIQLYSTQDPGQVLLRGGARLDDQIGATTKPALNFDPVMP